MIENLLTVISHGWKKYVSEAGQPEFPFPTDYFVMHVDIFPESVITKDAPGVHVNFAEMSYVVRFGGSVVL